MIQIVTLTVLLAASNPPADHGFVSRPLCAEISWPTLPIAVWYDQLQTEDEKAALEDAILYWNNVGIGEVFYLWHIGEPAPLVLIEALSESEPTLHGRIFLYYFACKITGATVYVADNALANEPWARAVHLLADALGLEHDTIHWSVAHQSNVTEEALIGGFSIVTASDQQRLMDAVIY